MATLLHPAAPHAERRVAVSPWPWLLLAAAVIALAIGWVGFAASDDAAYYFAAARWLQHAPQPGDDHWGTRFPLILSLVLALALFGKGALAMAVTALGWYAALVAGTWSMARRVAGARAGWIAALLVATMPVIVTNASTVSCDLAEAVFLLLGARLLGDVAAGEGGTRTALAAGAAFGVAVLCRETSALALFGLVPLFLWGRPVPRRALLLAGIGCVAVLGGEAVYQWLLTGDPLHRWGLAFHHDSHIDRAANGEGNLLVHPLIDPLLVLLVNDDFALLFWVAIAAGVARADRKLSPVGQRRMLVLGALGLATFLLVGALTGKLVLNPRYFTLPALAVAVLVAAWLDGMAPRARAGWLALLLGANALMLGVENQHPRWPAQALEAAAASHPDVPIVTDAEALHRALIPLMWAGLTRVRVGAPSPRALWFGRAQAMPAGAGVLARYPSPPTFVGGVLRALRLDGPLPGAVRHRLIAPDPELVLARPALGG